MSDKTLYHVTVEGQYYANIDGRKAILDYKEVFKLPSMNMALSVIRNELLHERLRSSAKHYTGFRTYKITHVETVGEQRKPEPSVLNLPIEQMNVQQLSDFCILRGFSFDPHSIGDILDARAQVLKLNQVYLTERMKNREAEHEIEKANELRALNELPTKEAGGLSGAHTPIPSENFSGSNPPNNNPSDEAQNPEDPGARDSVEVPPKPPTSRDIGDL